MKHILKRAKHWSSSPKVILRHLKNCPTISINKAGPQAKKESQDYLQENLAILAWTQQSSDIRLRPGPQPRLDPSAE